MVSLETIDTTFDLQKQNCLREANRELSTEVNKSFEHNDIKGTFFS